MENGGSQKKLLQAAPMHKLPPHLAACRSLPGETNGISPAQQGTKTLLGGLLLDKDILGDMYSHEN